MEYIKIILFLFMFLASIFLGKLLSKKYVERVKELKEVQNCLNVFKSKIKFTYEPIGEIFEEIYLNTKGNVGKIFKIAKENMKDETASKAWENAVECNQNNLTKEDKSVLKMLAKLLRSNRCRGAD